MASLSWDQVNTWRLSQHYLLERAERRELLEVVTGIGGVHAQLMSASELSLGSRGDLLYWAATTRAKGRHGAGGQR